MRKSPSGSPRAWSERRKEYQAKSGACSNPGQPSPCNRRARREGFRTAKALLESLRTSEAPE